MSQQVIPRDGPNAGLDRNGGESGPKDEDRSRLLDLLDERLRFEGLLARLSTTFINLPAEEVDGQIDRGLQQIVDFLGIERSGLGQFSEDGSQLVTTHSYTTPGIPPFPPVNLAAVLPWYTEQIRKGGVLRFSRLPDDLPPEAVAERQYCLRDGLRSQLTIPFKVGDAILGGIGFASFRRQRDWPDDLVQSLQLVAEIFANAQARKRAEEARRRGEEGFRLLLESTHAIPWVADARSWRFTYVGPQAGPLLGLPTDAWYGENFWAEHLHPDDRAEAVAFCLEHSRQFSDYQFEYRMVAADGRAVWIHDIVSVVAENGVPKTLRGFMIDVTALRSAREESRALREQLVRVGRVLMMGELAASIAHEVNQPLCAIVSNALAVQRLLAGYGRDLDEVREAVRDVIQDGQRASAVIARVRGLLQKAPLRRAPVAVNELVREVAALLRGDLARKGVALKFELADGLPPVLGDRVQLQQVILNLMVNGAEAMDGGACASRELLTRSAPDAGGGVVVSVRDAGVGLDLAGRDHIFDALFTTKPGGMGMGLALCKSIVEAHGGAIAAAANDGPGSTFHFTLPGARETTP